MQWDFKMVLLKMKRS